MTEKALVSQIVDSNPQIFTETDYRIILKSFERLYVHQPNILKWLMGRGHGTNFTVEHDNRNYFDIPFLNDIKLLDVSFKPPNKLIGLSATNFTGTIAQIGGGFRLSDDEMRTTFNGGSREPIMMMQLSEKLAQQEDYIFLHGDDFGNTGIQGITDIASSLTSTGGWSVSSSGILTNVIADIKQVNTAIVARGYPVGPVDCIVNANLWGVLNHTVKTYGDTTPMQYLKPMLNGGEFMVSQTLDATITGEAIVDNSSVTTNTALFIYKSPFSFYRASAKQVKWKVKEDLWYKEFAMKHRIGFASPIGSRFVYKIVTNITATS